MLLRFRIHVKAWKKATNEAEIFIRNYSRGVSKYTFDRALHSLIVAHEVTDGDDTLHGNTLITEIFVIRQPTDGG